jgi:UDP-N-acetylmuramoylalanine-D-glutamate ligase
MIESIRDLEKQHEVFKYMVFEDAGKKDERYNIKTEFEVKDASFLNYDDAYTVKAVSKIDEIPSSELSEALRDFILETGRYINIEDRLEFIEKFEHLITKECLLKLEEIGINLEEINKTLKKEGYYLLIKETIQALFDMMTSKTSEKFAVIAIDAILEKLQEKHKEVLKHITVDKSQYEKGMKAIIINPEINNEDPYKIAKTIQGMLKVTQEKQQNYPDKVTFIQDFEREIGEKCSAELKKIGVNLHLISLRYM